MAFKKITILSALALSILSTQNITAMEAAELPIAHADQEIAFVKSLSNALPWRLHLPEGSALEIPVRNLQDIGWRQDWQENHQRIAELFEQAKLVARTIQHEGLTPFSTDPSLFTHQVDIIKRLMSLPFPKMHHPVERLICQEICERLIALAYARENLSTPPKNMRCFMGILEEINERAPDYLNYLSFHELLNPDSINELAQQLQLLQLEFKELVKYVKEHDHVEFNLEEKKALEERLQEHAQKLPEIAGELWEIAKNPANGRYDEIVDYLTHINDDILSLDDVKNLSEDDLRKRIDKKLNNDSEYIRAKQKLKKLEECEVAQASISKKLIAFLAHISVDDFIKNTSALREREREGNYGEDNTVFSQLAFWYTLNTNNPLTDALVPFVFFRSNNRWEVQKIETLRQKMEAQLVHARTMASVQEEEAVTPVQLEGSLAQLKALKEGICWENADYKNKQAMVESVDCYAQKPWASNDEALEAKLAEIEAKEKTLRSVIENAQWARTHYLNLQGEEAAQWATRNPWVISEEQTKQRIRLIELGDSPQATQFMLLENSPYPYTLQIQMLEMSLSNIKEELQAQEEARKREEEEEEEEEEY